jgi:putative ABC transport system permease protein
VASLPQKKTSSERVKLDEILKSLFNVSAKVLINMLNSLFKENYTVETTAVSFASNEFVDDEYHILRGDLFLKLSDADKSNHYHIEIQTLIIGCIAGISLLVGGIGVMNIMLVSVTERTREIGIRMALGARRRDILVQFIIESIVLCLLGGLIGIILGYGGAMLIARLAKWPPLVSWWTIVVAFIFSMAVGLFFGIYPANQASKLDPIEALRRD